ncbi:MULTISPECIES: hypothetical protein [unclassified Nonomuraea]|uniref:hypothetical protein n=1 Tax=unclassified Nonomuraea TaxID=2593643 RepID=UPI00341B7901
MYSEPECLAGGHVAITAIAELCDGTQASLAAIRDLVTAAILDNSALADFLDKNGPLP